MPFSCEAAKHAKRTHGFILGAPFRATFRRDMATAFIRARPVAASALLYALAVAACALLNNALYALQAQRQHFVRWRRSHFAAECFCSGVAAFSFSLYHGEGGCLYFLPSSFSAPAAWDSLLPIYHVRCELTGAGGDGGSRLWLPPVPAASALARCSAASLCFQYGSCLRCMTLVVKTRVWVLPLQSCLLARRLTPLFYRSERAALFTRRHAFFLSFLAVVRSSAANSSARLPQARQQRACSHHALFYRLLRAHIAQHLWRITLARWGSFARVAR